MTRYFRYVAVGDSLTEGKGDPLPDGSLRGFADLLARSVWIREPRARYANLARPSVRTDEVLSDQVPAALALEPDLVTLNVGINDVISLRYRAERIEHNLEAIMTALASSGARVVTMTIADLSHLSWVAGRWRGRVDHLNTTIHATAERHGVDVVDLAAESATITHELMALDRVHPGPHGHLHLARLLGALLDLPEPYVAYMAPRPRIERAYRLYRTLVVAPRFVSKRLARRALIASQPAKRPQLQPL